MSKPAYEAVLSNRLRRENRSGNRHEIATGMKTGHREGATIIHTSSSLTGLTAEKHEAFVAGKGEDV